MKIYAIKEFAKKYDGDIYIFIFLSWLWIRIDLMRIRIWIRIQHFF
jgi:hypothetical protein